ncbi:MAG: RluA family pseudouridine synthase [Myxococcales bacterium]|nr:RluA family pseudouridine synthase [Myxococcales bacterium]
MSEAHRVFAGAGGVRLDRFLSSLSSVGSRSRARQAIDSGKVSVDGRPVAAGQGGMLLEEGSKVEIEWNRPGSSRAAVRGRRTLSDHGLRVVHEDADLVVVDKPAGLLTDAATRQQRRQPSVRSLLHEWLRARGGEAHIVHRLDRDTSGLVVIARNATAAERLGRQFREHSPLRLYWVVVQGLVQQNAGQWSHAMRWDPTVNRQRLARDGRDGAVVARAGYRVLERFGKRATVLEVQLQTGRRNQIRLHCELSGHPLVGERQYASGSSPPAIRAARQALHARCLGFAHPGSGQRMRFESELPGDLQALLARLRRGADDGSPSGRTDRICRSGVAAKRTRPDKAAG